MAHANIRADDASPVQLADAILKAAGFVIRNRV
jgi:hypothetical protein